MAKKLSYDFSGFDEIQNQYEVPESYDFSGFDEIQDTYKSQESYDFSGFDEIQSEDQQDSQGRWPGDKGYNLEEEEYADPSTGDIAKGVGAEVLASGAGAVAGGALGALGGPLAPITIPLGIAAGGFAGGFFGSLWAQYIEGQEKKSYGRAISAGTVSAIPFGGAGVKAITGHHCGDGIGKTTRKLCGDG